jgi:hypothetical protein
MGLSARNCPGRPQSGEFASYAKDDIDQVRGEDISSALELQMEETVALLEPIEDSLEQHGSTRLGNGT